MGDGARRVDGLTVAEAYASPAWEYHVERLKRAGAIDSCFQLVQQYREQPVAPYIPLLRDEPKRALEVMNDNIAWIPLKVEYPDTDDREEYAQQFKMWRDDTENGWRYYAGYRPYAAQYCVKFRRMSNLWSATVAREIQRDLDDFDSWRKPGWLPDALDTGIFVPQPQLMAPRARRTRTSAGCHVRPGPGSRRRRRKPVPASFGRSSVAAARRSSLPAPPSSTRPSGPMTCGSIWCCRSSCSASSAFPCS